MERAQIFFFEVLDTYSFPVFRIVLAIFCFHLLGFRKRFRDFFGASVLDSIGVSEDDSLLLLLEETLTAPPRRERGLFVYVGSSSLKSAMLSSELKGDSQ